MMRSVSVLRRWVGAGFMIGALVWSGLSHAQNTTVYDEQGELKRGSRSIAALGPNVAGDTVDLYVGALSLGRMDVDIPGNDSLRVAYGRRIKLSDHLGTWLPEIPRIYGTFASGGLVTPIGWVVYGNTTAEKNARCSRFGPPPESAQKNGNGVFDPDQFWSGHHLYVPGEVDELLLARDPKNLFMPDSGSYPIVTKSHWQVSCIPLSYGSGEGFLALSPSGTKYKFDRMVSRPYGGLTTSAGSMGRQEISIYPSQVTDRFGNYVTYTYDPSNPSRVTSIVASDGRKLTLAYNSDGSYTVTANVNGSSDPRTWSYGADGSLTEPDGSKWTYDLHVPLAAPSYTTKPQCTQSGWTDGVPLSQPQTNVIVAPSGARVSFVMDWVMHGQAGIVPANADPCAGLPMNQQPTDSATPTYAAWSVKSKTITGPGLPASGLVWTYQWGPPNGAWYCGTGCPGTKNLTVIDADGFQTRYTFNNRYLTDGELIQVDEGWNPSTSAALRSTSNVYVTPPGATGNSGQAMPNSIAVDMRQVQTRTIRQQGKTFTYRVDSFEGVGRPQQVTRFSDAGPLSRTETTTYLDLHGPWVINLVSKVTESGGAVPVENGYTALGSLQWTKKFGIQEASYQYYNDGTVMAQLDGASHKTQFSNYKRGLPQLVTFPPVNGVSDTISATVDDLGRITSRTDELKNVTGFGYDYAGRLNRITPPSGGFETTLTFASVGTAEYGLPAGHWAQSVVQSAYRKVTYFDALWRPVLERVFDYNNEAGTRSMVLRRYNGAGQTTFQSYPQRTINAVTDTPYGTTTAYDALQRSTQADAAGETGLLTTKWAYNTGFSVKQTNPRNYSTTTTYQAFDNPKQAMVQSIAAPEGANTAISVDVFGSPTSVTRSGTYSGGSISQTRRYAYDANHRLCKTIEPESGATLQGYDLAGNIAWHASGQSLPNLLSCDYGQVPSAAKITFAYDARNRLTDATYGDGSEPLHKDYWPDGKVKLLGKGTTAWTYDYNNRRQLTAEYFWPAGTNAGWGWSFIRDVDGYGHLSALHYNSDGTVINYEPNALGQATRAGTLAGNVTYHPNGMVASYTLGNGVTHTVTPSPVRGLPQQWKDAFGSTTILGDTYTYDENGNVTQIADGVKAAGDTTRVMKYDGLDRLTSANGIWGTGSYVYDPLDNIRSSTVGSRVLAHNINPTTNRLDSLSGSQNIAFAYDANGNVTQRGSQSYTFNIDNQLTSAPGKAYAYAYDGSGRNRWTGYADGSSQLSAYSMDGQLLLTDHSVQGLTWRFYLAGKLIAEDNALNGVRTTTFVHTDALGSPVARTNTAGQVISRTAYEPYGGTAAGTNPKGIGFTGHLNLPDVGLVYMQQRYYDPIAGRFLSVDPVVADGGTGNDFNRFRYGNNNPYRFKDPDGRFAFLAALPELIAVAWEAATTWFASNASAAAVGTLAAATISSVADGAKKDEVSKAGANGDKTEAESRAGKKFTPKGKREVKDANAAENDGEMKCEGCGKTVVNPQQHQKGVTPPDNEAHVDHIEPRSKGGAGSPSNGQVLCRTCNLGKSDN